jgi:hypothetical protein
MTLLLGLLGLLFVAAALIAGTWALAWNTGEFTAYVREWEGRVYRYRVKNNHWLVKLTPWNEFAMTIGDQMFCEGVLEDFPMTHGHEFNHVVEGVTAMAGDGPVPDQGARRYGLYLRDLVKVGYRMIAEERRSDAFAMARWQEFTRDKLTVAT